MLVVTRLELEEPSVKIVYVGTDRAAAVAAVKKDIEYMGASAQIDDGKFEDIDDDMEQVAAFGDLMIWDIHDAEKAFDDTP